MEVTNPLAEANARFLAQHVEGGGRLTTYCCGRCAAENQCPLFADDWHGDASQRCEICPHCGHYNLVPYGALKHG
jgi:DNA-directed RNA polymerase subunit RPC12/RpoP